MKHFVILAALLLCAYAKLNTPECDATYSERDFNGKKRNETIACAIRSLDVNHDGAIDEDEYNDYCDEELNYAEWYMAPKFSTLQEKCDCNLDGKIFADEMFHAFETCLESDFWVNRVYGYVC